MKKSGELTTNRKRAMMLEQQTKEILARFPEELRVFVELRFGIQGRPKHSHAELARVLGLPVKRVREAEAHALRGMTYGGAESIDLGLSALRVNRSPSPAIADAIEKIDRLTPELIAHLRERQDDLRKVRWGVFEHLVGEFLAEQGFRDVRLVGRDPSTSADLYSTLVVDSAGVTVRFFIEVKRWRERVGITVINEVLGAMITERERHGWHAGMIVAIGGFADLRNYSRMQLDLRGVQLKERSDLLRWLSHYRPNANGLWLPNPKRKMP